MKFIYREQVPSVFEYKRTETNFHWIIKHFLHHEDEVLYFVEKKVLRAVVSVGDVFRFLEEKTLRKIINTQFTSVLADKLEEAETFFSEQSTIHELPVIDSDGYFVGVVKSGNRNPAWLWERFRYRIKESWFNRTFYYEKLSEKFMNHFKGKVFLIDLPDDKKAFGRLRTSQEKEVFKRKQMISPLEQLQRMGEQEERDYWGPAYEENISKCFVKEFSHINVQERNGCKYYLNGELSHYITFDKGKRTVINKNGATRKIYLTGPCTIFGAYVTDTQTIEFYLQSLLEDHGNSYKVVNLGSLGRQCEFEYLLTECFGDEDLIVVATSDRELTGILSKYSNAYSLGDYSDIFDAVSDPMSCILDTFRHVNYKISQLFAQRIYDSIKEYLLPENTKLTNEVQKPVQDYFISWGIFTYYKEFALDYNLNDLGGRVGAIVMNCNPFTKGHQYLIEYAAAKVDTLIIFVVEEDASAFSFHDRMEMVRRGTAHIGNLKVVPSGRYNISKSTFAQYFEKEKKVQQLDSMEYDLRIFCEVIADCMGISCRFAGEEPTDLVTRKYNETMKYILPQYGMEFIEIPRLKLKDAEYISASKVRCFLKQEDWKSASAFLPDTTISYLKNMTTTGK